MAGLPEGWDMDYDGQRWFYKYKPTGHIQYHFPKEGDEFPDFVDAYSPAPDLAPEERLESQQQVRRHTSTTTASAHAKARREENGWESRMSATARPVSAVWDGDAGGGGGGGDDDNAVFQPENFMYLGPGAYNDVSPLAEEEEEAARRVVAGGIEDKIDKPLGKGVSPIASEKTTPAHGAVHAEPIMGEPVAVPPTVPEETHEFVPMIDSREVPMAPPDPVGVIAEMPTEDTGPARVETNPPPVEMADNMVLAPIETAPPPLLAELPEQSSPVERKNEDPQLAPGSLRNYGGQMQPLRVQKKPTAPVEEVVGGFQAYKPRSAGTTPDISRWSTPMREEPVLERRRTFQPEDHLMMNSKPAQPPYRDATSTPAVLAPPQVPPKHPIDDSSTRNAPIPPVMGNSGSGGPQGPQPPPGNLSYMPSVLKAGRIGNRQDSFSTGPSTLASLDDDRRASLTPGQQGDLAHMPSVLKPARGRAPSQPGQQPQFPPQNLNAPPGQGHGYKPPAQGQHPPSMTPAPHVQQQRLQEEPKMGIQRVNTVPDSLPSQRPASMIQGGTYQGQQMNVPAGVNQAQQPARPASVMPNMMGGHPQQAAGRPNPPIPPKQGVVPPYPDQIPATAPPPSGQAAPFGRPVQNPPYPVDNLPYPDDPPMQRPPSNFPPQGAGVAPGPGHLNRRHSSFSGAEVSPIDSRHGSMSSMYPLQTPSPMENSRRGSSSASLNQAVNPNYTPSPVSQSSSSMYGFTPTPPSAPTNHPQQGYFTTQDVEGQGQGQGHAIAAQNMLRKKSLSRGPPDARRSSVGSPLSSPPTTESYGVAQQGLARSQSLRQTSQGNVVPQNQVVPVPTPPPQGQQFLGRIEEHEEVPSGTVSRSSTMSGSPEMRRSSMASSQHSPAGSRRTSLQGDSPGGASPSQPQGQYSPSNQFPQGSMPPQGQFASQGPIQGQGPPGAPYPGQTPMQNPAQLQRKPSKGQAPGQGAPRPQGQPPYPNQMPVQGQVPVGGPMPSQGQMPPGQQGQRPHGQPVPGQTPPPAQTSHHGPGKLLRKLSKTQPSPPQAAPQGQPPYPQQAPGPKLLQRRSSQGPANPMGQAPPQGQMPPGQMPHPGQGPNGRVQPQIQIPQNQQQWAPGMQPPAPQGFRPGSVPPQGPQSAGPKEGKGGKWFKLFKGGSKSTAPTPTTPTISSPVTAINNAPPRWGGGEYSTPAVWQPGQPTTASPGPGFQGNMPPQPGQAPQPGQMPPQPVHGPGNAAPGQMPPGPGNMAPHPNHMAAQPSRMPQPGQMPPQSVPGPGRAPPGQGPPGPVQMAPQPGQMPIHPGQMGPKSGQAPPQPSQMGPQRGQAPPGMGQIPPGPSQIAMQPGQRPLGPGQMPPQSDPKPLLPGEMAPQPGRIPSGQMPPPNPQAPPPGAARIAPSPSAGHVPANAPSPMAPLSTPSKAGPSSAHQNLPSQIPPPGRNNVSRPPQPMPVPQTRTPEPHQPRNIPAPIRPDTLRASPEPPLASSPGLSDAGLSSMSRVSSHQKRDSLSDAGSITTIEVSEAKPQPVLRPSIVQVHRRSTDMFRKSEEIQRNMEALANADAAPRGSSDTSRFEQPLTIQKAPSPAPKVQPQQPISRPGSATPRDILERSLSPAPLFSKGSSPKAVQNGPSNHQENNMEPTPLFSKPNPPVSAVAGLPSQQMKPAPLVQQQPPQPAPPPADDKWAKKPVVDYSGGDWGDDDGWDY